MFRNLVITLDSDDKRPAPQRPQPADERTARRMMILRRLQAGRISAEQAARLLAAEDEQ